MKNIVAIVTFFLAFSITANAQDKKASAESLGRKDAIELVNFLKLESKQLDSFTALFVKKHTMNADNTISQEERNSVPMIMEKKIEASVTDEQMKKLRANPALLKKLTN